MKVEISELVVCSFIVEVEDGLKGDALDDAIAEARVQFTGQRYENVTDWTWEPAA